MRHYRLAKEEEIPELEAMYERAGWGTSPLAFPIIVCEQDGKLLGFCARNPESTEAILLEPLIVEADPSRYVYLRLIEAWDNIMWNTGVDRYLFRLHRNHPRQTAYRRMMGRAGQAKKYGKPQGKWQYYIRVINQ